MPNNYILDCECAGVYGRLKCTLCSFKTSCHAHFECHLRAHKRRELELDERQEPTVEPSNSVSLPTTDLVTAKETGNESVEELQELSICSCDICGKIFESTALLTKHLTLHAKEDAALRISKRSSKRQSKTAAKKRDLASRVIKPLSKKGASKPKLSQLLNSSKVKSLPDKNKSRISDVYCEELPENYTDVDSTNTKLHKCVVCNRGFASASKLRVHGLVHTGEKPHKCPECDRSYTSKGELGRHIKSHRVPKPFKCTECDSAFQHADQLARHRKFHVAKELFTCEHCGKSYRWKHYLKIHERTHLGMRPFLCCECGASFTDQSDLRRHEKIHTDNKPFTCQVCQKGFRRKYDLRTHYKMHPGVTPPLDETPQSDQSTPVKRKVKKQTAGRVKMYPCSVCHKTFARKDYLAVHERLHTGLKPYKCSKCDKRFAQIPAWKCHEVTHGERKFACATCGKLFFQKSTLHTHEMIHTGAKPYKCTFCDAAYRYKDQLLRHEDQHYPPLNEVLGIPNPAPIRNIHVDKTAAVTVANHCVDTTPVSSTTAVGPGPVTAGSGLITANGPLTVGRPGPVTAGSGLITATGSGIMTAVGPGPVTITAGGGPGLVTVPLAGVLQAPVAMATQLLPPMLPMPAPHLLQQGPPLTTAGVSADVMNQAMVQQQQQQGDDVSGQLMPFSPCSAFPNDFSYHHYIF